MVAWGFLGAGSIARTNLAPAVHRSTGSRLAAVASRDVERARALGPDTARAEYSAVLDDPDIDIVYICLHNSVHHEWAMRALEAGKHVLCEKPLGLTAVQTAEMADAADKLGLLLVEAAWNRWHPRSRQLERILADQRIGEVTEVLAEFSGPAPDDGNYRWAADLGGGALLDLGCYAVSAVLGGFSWQTPDEIRAVLSTRRPGEADDAARAVLGFGAGRAEIGVGFGTSSERLVLRGSAGRIEVGDPAFTAGAGPSSLRVHTPVGAEEYEYAAVDPYELMVTEVAAAVRGESSYVVPASQSTAVARTLDGIRRAAASGRSLTD